MKSISAKKWFYPLVYFLLVLIAFLPPITQNPFDPRQTQDVIKEILMVSISGYQSWGWIFHLLTMVLIIWIVSWPQTAGRVVAGYFGFNYLLIAALQTNGVTQDYGFAIQTGALVACVLIGLVWIAGAVRGDLTASFHDVPQWRWILLPLAVLVFWSPVAYEGSKMLPNFDPRLLVTSADYGLTYCFMTPVFLFLLVLFYPRVNAFAFRVTAFNALIYGLLNLTHWFSPDLRWMGVMHIPLLVISAVALFLPWMERSSHTYQAAP
jgi:hypothetical protein